MKWLYFITTLILFTVLIRAKSTDGADSTRSDISPSLESKTHRKRELFGHLGKFSHGYDIAHIKHSYIKPLVVQYPVQSFPIGVKIPFKNPHQKLPSAHNFNHHGSSSKLPHFHIQNPIHLPKPAWPSNNCHHGQGSHDVPRPLPPPIPPTTPIIPTSAGNNIPVFSVPIRPALVPPVFDAQPFITVAAPPAPIAPIPIAPPVAHLAPIAPVAPLVPLRPIAPAPLLPAPALIKHGLSTHSFSFATFPRHHYVNTLPALAHAPAHVLPAPVAHVAPVAPLIHHRIPIHQYPIPAAPVHLPFGRVPLGPAPLGAAQHPHLFNQIPVNFPVAHNAPVPLPAQTPLGVSPFPQHVPAGQNPFLIQGPPGHGISEQSPIPQHAPAGQNPFLFQGPSGHGISEQSPVPAQTPMSDFGFSQQPIAPQNPFLSQGPSSQFPTNSFLPEGAGGSSVNPEFQDQGNIFANSFPNSQPDGSNVWTPMTNQNPEQFPTFQYPQQEQFPSQINPEGETSQGQPQGAGSGPGNEQGYTYQQNGNQAFQDGQNIQQNLQQQAEQQFLQAQQYFNQQGQPSQEQNLQNQQEQGFQQQQQQQQQYSSSQQQQETDDNVQQFSQQQFISGQQLASSDPQHDPQLPQALPEHHLSGRPINQAYVRINHRRRLRKRPQQNQEE